MQVTCEISLYPLTQNYEQTIIEVIKYLKSDDQLSVMTTAMSTYVKGDSDHVFSALQRLYQQSTLSEVTNSLVIKIINRNLPIEDGFLTFT